MRAAVYLCYHASCTATALYKGAALPVSQFRLNIIQTRGDCRAREFKAPSIAFSLGGRRISETKYSLKWETKGKNGGMPSAVATFAEGVKISAWSFTTAADSNPDCDPWAFSAQRREAKDGAGGGEAEGGSDAVRCGKDDRTCAAGGTCSLSSHSMCREWFELRQLGWMSNQHVSSDEMLRSGAAEVPIERRSEAYFDMSPPTSKYCEVRCTHFRCKSSPVCMLRVCNRIEDTFVHAFIDECVVRIADVIDGLIPRQATRKTSIYACVMAPCGLLTRVSLNAQVWCCIIEATLSLAAVFSMSVLHKFAVGRVLMALAVGCWIPVILACQPLSYSRLSYESIALLPWCVLTTIGILHQRSFSYCSSIAAVYHAVVTWCAPPEPARCCRCAPSDDH